MSNNIDIRFARNKTIAETVTVAVMFLDEFVFSKGESVSVSYYTSEEKDEIATLFAIGISEGAGRDCYKVLNPIRTTFVWDVTDAEEGPNCITDLINGEIGLWMTGGKTYFVKSNGDGQREIDFDNPVPAGKPYSLFWNVKDNSLWISDDEGLVRNMNDIATQDWVNEQLDPIYRAIESLTVRVEVVWETLFGEDNIIDRISALETNYEDIVERVTELEESQTDHGIINVDNIVAGGAVYLGDDDNSSPEVQLLAQVSESEEGENTLTLAFSFANLKGAPGKDGKDGKDGSTGEAGEKGDTGSSSRIFLIYQNNGGNTPARPQGGYWDVQTNTLKECPVNWSTDNLPTTESEYVTWMSSGTFTSDNNGKQIGNWSLPFRITGKDGENGKDGNNTEYIYCLTRGINIVPYFDGDSNNTAHQDAEFDSVMNFFDAVNDDNSAPSSDLGYAGAQEFTWYDRAQVIDKINTTEWVCYRMKDSDGEWETWGGPTPWAHWGSDGTDGDGVEYIFYKGQTEDACEGVVKFSELTDEKQKIIYQLNDFFPGESWFTEANKTKATAALSENGITLTDSDWTNRFGFSLGWTDDPSDVSETWPYEWVSVRKSSAIEGDSDEGKWGDFSEPSLWAKYGKDGKDGGGRIFMVYYNQTTSTVPTKPDKATTSWDIENNKLIGLPTPSADNKDCWIENSTYISGAIVWMSVGNFSSTGACIQWSEPMKLSGDPGKDGSNQEYIYFLSPNPIKTSDYPQEVDGDITAIETLFESVENSTSDPKTGTYGTAIWYDNAQPIDSTNKYEYIWCRYKDAGDVSWSYYPEPALWSHWGSDGTDGDGVEYIFKITSTNVNPKGTNWDNLWPSSAAGNIVKWVIYQMDDFVPSQEWFNDTNKSRVEDAIEEYKSINSITDTIEIDNTSWAEGYGLFNETVNNWTDDPSDVNIDNPYEWVSVRRYIGKTETWGPFEEPSLWAKYSKEAYTSFAFTTADSSVDLSTATVTGTIGRDLPNNTTFEEITYTWADTPTDVNASSTVWMTKATIVRDNTTTAPVWSKPSRLADSSNINVEWCSTALSDSNFLTVKEALKNNAAYNYGTFEAAAAKTETTASDIEITAETNWRTYVAGLAGNPVFSDNPTNAHYMATATKKNGKWTGWDLVNVKGEKGDPGTSISIKGYVSDDLVVYYTGVESYASAEYNFNNSSAVLGTLISDSQVSSGDIAVVFPEIIEDDERYSGTITIFVRSSSAWIRTELDNLESIKTATGIEITEGYSLMCKGRLLVWDGDGFIDAGVIKGADGKSIYVGYANLSGGNYILSDDPTSEYIGFCICLPSEWESKKSDPANYEPWRKFKGEDGFGYEYIYCATEENTRPSVPTRALASNVSQTTYWDSNVDNNDFFPITALSSTNNTRIDWQDDPIEVSSTNKYIWMCYRTRKEDGKWGSFIGNADGTAKLWNSYTTVSIVSTVFKRSTTGTPDTPTGGSFDSPRPTDESWSIGIPTGSGAIYSSSRKFTNDGKNQDATWTTPSTLYDNEYIEYEFSKNATQPGNPLRTTPIDSENTAGSPDANGWYDDPVDGAVWVAMCNIVNSQYEKVDGAINWKISRIEGEQGESNFYVHLSDPVVVAKVNSSGTVINSIDNTYAKLYYGETIYSGSGTVKWSVSPTNKGVTINSNNGTLSFFETTGTYNLSNSLDSDVTVFTVTAKLTEGSNELSFTKNFSIIKNRDGVTGDSYQKKYSRFDDSWGTYSDVEITNTTSDTPTITFITTASSGNRKTGTITDSPLGADASHCVEVMTERSSSAGTWGAWGNPVITSRQFSDSEIQGKINANLSDANSTLVTFIKSKAGEQVTSQTGDFATTYATKSEVQTVEGKIPTDYINSSAFETYKSDATSKYASAATMAANSALAKGPNGGYIWSYVDDEVLQFYSVAVGDESDYTSLEDVHNDELLGINNGWSPSNELNDEIDYVIAFCNTYFKTYSSELAEIRTTVGDGVSAASIIAAVNGTDGRDAVAAIFTQATNAGGSSIWLSADNIKLTGNISLEDRLQDLGVDNLNVTNLDSSAEVTDTYDNTNIVATRKAILNATEFKLSYTCEDEDNNISVDNYLQLYIDESCTLKDESGNNKTVYKVPTLLLMCDGIQYKLNPEFWQRLGEDVATGSWQTINNISAVSGSSNARGYIEYLLTSSPGSATTMYYWKCENGASNSAAGWLASTRPSNTTEAPALTNGTWNATWINNVYLVSTNKYSPFANGDINYRMISDHCFDWAEDSNYESNWKASAYTNFEPMNYWEPVAGVVNSNDILYWYKMYAISRDRYQYYNTYSDWDIKDSRLPNTLSEVSKNYTFSDSAGGYDYQYCCFKYNNTWYGNMRGVNIYAIYAPYYQNGVKVEGGEFKEFMLKLEGTNGNASRTSTGEAGYYSFTGGSMSTGTKWNVKNGVQWLDSTSDSRLATWTGVKEIIAEIYGTLTFGLTDYL